MDAAYYAAPGFDGSVNTLIWTGGVALEWWDGQVGLYLPLVGSANLMDRVKELGNTGQRIAFRLLLSDMFQQMESTLTTGVF
ncbi:MAG: hypothetical protein R2795_12715 [Saprospiraceae bacterium]